MQMMLKWQRKRKIVMKLKKIRNQTRELKAKKPRTMSKMMVTIKKRARLIRNKLKRKMTAMKTVKKKFSSRKQSTAQYAMLTSYQ